MRIAVLVCDLRVLASRASALLLIRVDILGSCATGWLSFAAAAGVNRLVLIRQSVARVACAPCGGVASHILGAWATHGLLCAP
jgi:hypothetical protein